MKNRIERAAAVIVLATAWVAAGAGHARAGVVTYTETATVSGSLGSATFTDATITTTQTADPANGVVIPPLTKSLNVRDITSVLTITGGGLVSPLSASFTFTTYTFVSPTSGTVGFGQLTLPFGNAAILAAANAAPLTYDLTTSLGPVSGPSFYQTPRPYGTTAGDLILNDVGATVTFQAVAAVPEPSSLALVAAAFAPGLAVAAGRRLRRGGR